jgi:hypothetical protein
MPFVAPRVIKRPWTNGAYGIPRGKKRRHKPFLLACIHISGNERTAAYPDPLAGARAEIAYMDRKGSNGPTGHVTVARDGTVFHHLDHDAYTAWLNGDVLRPNTRLPGVARMERMRTKQGWNANEAFYLEGESVGSSKHPLTPAQIESWAWLLARASIHTGIPIERGTTVLGHCDINTVNRPSDPFPAKVRERRFKAMVDRANEWKRHLTAEPQPEPEPEPEPEPVDPCADTKAALDAAMDAAEQAEARYEDLRGRADQVLALLGTDEENPA